MALMPGMPEKAPETVLSKAIASCRQQLVGVAIFSGVVNLLQLTVSLYMMQVFDRVLSTRSLDTLYYLTLIAMFALLVMAVLDGLRGQVMQRIASWVEGKAAPEAFLRAIESQLRGRPYRMEALRDLSLCRNWLGSPASLTVFDVPWVPIYLAVIFALHPVLGWIAFGGALILFALTLANEWATGALVRQATTAGMASQRRAESIVRNAEVIDSMGMAPAVLQRWREGLASSMPPQERAADRAAMLLSLTRFFRLTIQVAVLGIGAWLVLEQQLTAGASIAASIIMGRALAPVEQMIGGWKQLVQARQSHRRLLGFMALPRIRPPGMALPEPTGRVAAERVTFGFPGQPVAIIKGISFNLAAGESLAVIGPSAAGKTTLIRLLIGTLQPSAGTVRLDGADVFTWQREDFGKYVGYLPQDVELFDGTVMLNIGRMRDADPEQVFEAARLAGCHEMILRLPQGYDTEIGDGGQHLSGGQRQLIGLARAMFGNPHFVVLDEPNSNLDGDAEQALIRGLEQLKARGTTVILVSHRPTLVQGVDKVLLLRDGAVEAFGPRAEVLKRLVQGQGGRPTEVVPAAPRAEGGAR
jgi:ATP-binding cassette subfamily C protein/ATP-binding cassette subfamily C protein EexD